MILSRVIGTVKNEDGTIKTKGKISLFSVFIGSSPAKSAYCIPKSTKTPFEVYNNFLLENAPVNTFKQLEYLAGDTMNSTGVYDSYLLSTTITSEGVSSFDSTSKVKWFDPEDKSLYRTKTGAPAPGECPSPVFIETPRGNVILISEDSSFTKYYEYAVKTHVTDIYNLIPGKHYFYRILEGSNIVKTGEFDTKGLVRMIRLNALRNVRDCGGWPTVDGLSRFKYGIIFRGSALGFYVDDSINTAANRALDLSILENDFGVTGEVDLNGDFTIDPFYVGHNNSSDNILSFSATCYYGMPTAYSQFYNVLNFILLRVANGGAVYVHCELGRDRTGSFVSVIQALCGVCDDGILKDYEITTFWGKGTYRYYLEHDDTQNASRDMWKEFASSGTTQERVLSWFRNNYVANSIGNKATADEAIDYIKSLLLEPILLQEELPVTPSEPEEEIEEYSVETSTILNYLDNRYYKSSLLSNTKTQGDYYIILTPVISTSEAGTTKGLTTTYLKSLLNMTKSDYSSYKSPQFVSAICQPSAKPRPYTINNQNVNSVEITDLTTNETFILSNKTDLVTASGYVGAYENGANVVKSAKFDSLPVIGTPARSHVLDKVKPIFLLALSGGPTKAAIFKYVKSKDYSNTTYSGVTGSLGKIEYNSSNMNWAAWDNISVGTVAAPKLYTIVLYKNDGSYYNKVDDMYFGPLHVNYPTKIYNLIPGRIYHCVVKDADGNILEDKRLKPTGRLRMIHFEGVRNVRDLGGWPCYDEDDNQIGTIAYDKLYRGSRPEPTATYYGRIGISLNDRRMAYNFMHIGALLDLREGEKDGDGGTYYLSNTSTSYFSLNSTTDTVPRERVSMASYWAAFDYTRWNDGANYINPIENLLTCIGKIIKNLNQDKSTYFNCAQGADRTAVVAMVIEALVGVKDDSLLKDWEITSFSGNIKLHSDDTPYIGSIGDYRALNELCDDAGLSPSSGHHDLVRLIEMKENLETYYGPGTLAENIINWFKTICNRKKVSASTSYHYNYFNVLENREYYNTTKTGEDKKTAVKMTKTAASTVSESYLSVINSKSGLTFNTPEEVIAFLKNKLVNPLTPPSEDEEPSGGGNDSPTPSGGDDPVPSGGDDPTPTPSDETTTESTLTVLGGYNISSVLDDNGTTTSIPAKNGKSILIQSNNLTLTTTPSLETILGYSKLNGEIITNLFSIDRDTIVTPKILGNLLYNNRSGKRWTIDTTNYRVNATTTTGFYAMEPIPVVHGLSLTFYFPTRANQSVSFEILHTTVAGRFFTYDDYYAKNQKAVTLNLNSEGKADYTVEGLTGFAFCNFATTETTGFTTFTATEVKKILAKYKDTTAWSVPTFNFEKVIDDVGRITLSMVYYQGYLVVFYTNISPVKIVDLANKTIRTVSGSVKNTDIHANAAHLLPIKYSEDDYFPMILVGEENCRVVRLVGSDPATVTASTVCTWRIEAQESESSIYDSGLAHGDTLVVGNELYTIKDSSSAGLWKAIDFDLSDINNYIDRVKGTNPIYATKITDDICGGNYGLDCTSFLVGSKKYLAYSYGPIPLYWESGNYFLRWSGLILADFDTKKTMSYLPLEGLGCPFSEHEPDGVAYAGDNTFYLLFNAPSVAPIYKFTITLPTSNLDWSKEKWVPIGDSLSDLTITQANNKYLSYIGSLIPALTVLNTFLNGAYKFVNAGCGYYLGENSFYDVSKYAPSDATVITVFGSMNDRQYLSISGSSYTSKLSKVNSSSTGTNRITWIENPHLDTASDKTLAGYVADTLRRLHSNAPNAKVIVIPGLYYKNDDLTISLNTYFCYQAVVLALIDEENAGSWLSFESWYLDITLTRSVVDGNVRYTRSADSFIEDTKLIDKWLSSNLNQTFDSRKITNADFGLAYCYDYSTSTVYGHWNNDYHLRYLAVKFAHVLINVLGGTENDLPIELRYNNID